MYSIDVKENGYSIVKVEEGKITKHVVAIHNDVVEIEGYLKGRLKMKLGSPINETTMTKHCPGIGAALGKNTKKFRYIDGMGMMKN